MSPQKTLITIFIVISIASFVTSAPPSIDVRDFFLGVWQIEYTSDSQPTQGLADESAITIEHLSWNISSVPFSSVLRGTSIDADERVTTILLDFPEVSLTPEGTISAHSNSLKGKFLSSSSKFLFAHPLLSSQTEHDSDDETVDEDEDEDADDFLENDQVDIAAADTWNPIFSFDFQSYPANLLYSSGAWGSAGLSHYQLFITDPKGFILNIVQQDASGQIKVSHVIVGRKIVPPPEPGFFQKYSMIIMIGFMLVMQFFKARAQAGVAPEADPTTTTTATTSSSTTTTPPTVTKSRSGNAEVVHHKTQ